MSRLILQIKRLRQVFCFFCFNVHVHSNVSSPSLSPSLLPGPVHLSRVWDCRSPGILPPVLHSSSEGSVCSWEKHCLSPSEHSKALPPERGVGHAKVDVITARPQTSVNSRELATCEGCSACFFLRQLLGQNILVDELERRQGTCCSDTRAWGWISSTHIKVGHDNACL